MDFHQFEYVMAIAEEKSISRAAKKLYISQPSLSQYIMRLENNLGVKLFDRTANSITLTFAGEKYIQTAKNILNLNTQLERELSDIAGSRKGRLAMGVPNQTGRHILPLVLPEFHKRFPEIEIVVEEDVTMQLEEMLLSGKIDIAILNLPIQHDKILYETISVERIFLVAPQDHWICSKAALDKQHGFNFSCLKDEKFVLLEQGQRTRLIADEIFHKAQFKPNVLLEIRNLDTAYRIAAAGMGFTFVPENVIWLLNTKQYNNNFLIDDMNFTFVIAYRRGEYITKAMDEFIAIAKEVMDLNHKERTVNGRDYGRVYI
ncbi:MAG: LysR family transcriptional regulator [Bacillota bacterium]|nr:LysR family transcriptional regulator [Bacillota bacterium]